MTTGETIKTKFKMVSLVLRYSPEIEASITMDVSQWQKCKEHICDQNQCQQLQTMQLSSECQISSLGLRLVT